MDFFKNYAQYIQGITLCIDNKLIIPAQTLIYSGIDSFAWIAYGDIPVNERFTKWIENYMYKKKKLDPRPIDLYAARCAMLHTLTPESNLSKNGQAIQIAYAWGNASLKELKEATKKSEQDVTCVHLNDLFESFKLGISYFLDTDSDTEECRERMSKHYSNINQDIIDVFNRI